MPNSYEEFPSYTFNSHKFLDKPYRVSDFRMSDSYYKEMENIHKNMMEFLYKQNEERQIEMLLKANKAALTRLRDIINKALEEDKDAVQNR